MAIFGGRVYLVLAVALFGALGFSMLWGAWHFSSDTRQFMRNAVPAPGTIISLERKTSKDSRGKVTISYYPTIEFTTQDGEKRKYDSNQSVSQYEYPVGESINVLYDRLNPADARMDLFSDLWATPVILCVMGSIFTGVALLIYFIFYRNMEPGVLFTAGGFAVVVTLTYGGAWWLGRDSIHLQRHGERATGIVVNVNPNVVEFKTKEGKTIKYNTNVSSYPPDYSDGDRVSVLYDPNVPKRAKIDSFGDMWFFPAVAGGCGTVFLLVSMFCLYMKMRNR